MKQSKNVHVVPHDKGWATKRPGNDRASTVSPTQREAIAEGTEAAKKTGGEVVIHGKDGQIREKNSYGNDPKKSKG